MHPNSNTVGQRSRDCVPTKSQSKITFFALAFACCTKAPENLVQEECWHHLDFTAVNSDTQVHSCFGWSPNLRIGADRSVIIWPIRAKKTTKSSAGPSVVRTVERIQNPVRRITCVAPRTEMLVIYTRGPYLQGELWTDLDGREMKG